MLSATYMRQRFNAGGNVPAPGKHATIDDLARLNMRAGRHYFDAGALKAFGARVYDEVFPVTDGWYFVESITPPHSRRVYRVCHINYEGRVTRVAAPDGTRDKKACFYASKRAAVALAARLAERDRVPPGHVLTWIYEDVSLVLSWSGARQAGDNRPLVTYRFLASGRIIFEGDNYGIGAARQSALTLVTGLMGFLTLRPVDTDDEYFKSYTPDQRAWADSWTCAELANIVTDAEESGHIEGTIIEGPRLAALTR